MPLKLGGKPLLLKPISPSVAKLIAFLDKQPKDEVFTSVLLSEKTGVSVSYLKCIGTAPELKEYGQQVGRLRYWGNPAAIKELRRQMEAM